MKPKHIKPIIFNTNMVKAILGGRKTVTRRVVKLPRCGYFEHEPPQVLPPYQVGDILYVRETWGDYRECTEDGGGAYVLYRADYPDGAKQATHPNGIVYELPQWHPSIHMPKEAARIWLKVTDVRVERLQDMCSDYDNFVKEGIKEQYGMRSELANWFADIWNATIKEQDLNRYGWDANPWVWVIEFERIREDGKQ